MVVHRNFDKRNLCLDLCPNSFGCTIDGIGYIEPGSHKDLENCKSYFCHCSGKSSSQWIRSQTVARKWEKQTSYEACSFSAADIGMYCHFSEECEEIFNEPCHPTIVLKSNHDQMCPRVGCVGR